MEQPENLEKMAGMMPGAAQEAKDAAENAYKAHYEADLKELLQKSFKRHDTKNTNVLDLEETTVFFANLIRISVQTFADSKKAWAPMVAGFLPNKPTDDALAEEKDAFNKKIVEKMGETEKGMLADYNANKDARDKAAFDIVDANKDGALQEEEFLKIFGDPTTNKAFNSALGFGEDEYFAKLTELMT